MRKIWLSLACVLSIIFLSTPIEATSLPIPSMQEVGDTLVGVQPDACEPGATGAVFEFERNGIGYKLLVLVRSRQAQYFIMLSTADGDKTPVWVGSVKEDGTLVVRKEMVYGDFVKWVDMVGGICGVLGREV